MNDFRRWAWCTVAVLAAAVALLATAGPLHQEFAVLSGLLLMFAFLAERARKAAARADGHGLWEITVNGVAVGTISGEDYLRLKRQAYCDPHNALDQVTNVVSVATAFLGALLVAIPVTLFWCTVLLMLVSPDLAGTVLEAARAGATPAQLVASIAALLAFCAVVVVVLAGAAVVLFGSSLGFRNRYDEAISERLRRYCKSPATGDVQLFRPIGNTGRRAPAVDTLERK